MRSALRAFRLASKCRGSRPNSHPSPDGCRLPRSTPAGQHQHPYEKEASNTGRQHVRMVRPSLSGQSARGTFRFAKAAAFNQTVVLINRAERFTSFIPRFLARTTTNPLDRWDGLKNIPISMRREVAVRVQPIPLCVPGGMGTAGS